MKHIKAYEKYTPTASVTDKMKHGDYVSKYTDADYNYKIGDFVRLLDKGQNRLYIPDDDIYKIVLRHIDKFGGRHYRLKKTSGVPYYLDELWQKEKNVNGTPLFVPLTDEEAESFELKRNAKKYNI